MGNDSLAFRLFRPLADKLARDRSVGEAVETVAFDAVLIEFPRQCEAPHQLGICPVKCRVEGSRLPDFRPETPDRMDEVQRLRLMQRRKRHERFHLLHGMVVNQDRSEEHTYELHALMRISYAV